MKRLLSIVVAALLGASAGATYGQQSSSIQNSPHNLSASGPGTIRASAEEQICIFCHTPHNAAPIQPLWNRNVPVTAYTPYSSNSLDAKPGQPTGSSKLCLSCHDGTIALGSVLSRNQPIQMVGGITTLPPGAKSNLGTDLSDDHPISFRYDEALAAKDPKLKSPHGLPTGVRLDRNSELQCTSCHDAHNDQFGKFLVMDNSQSQLCNACHSPGKTTIASHTRCASCHQQHTAPSGPYLLKAKTVGETCFTCHGTQPSPEQGKNVASTMTRLSRHDTDTPVNVPNHAPNMVSCEDCHESHTMASDSATAPLISPKLGSVAGVNTSGALVPKAQYEYEVCFKCHAKQSPQNLAPSVTRQIVQLDTSLEFAQSAVSSHPVVAPGKAMDVPSLKPGLTTASVIYCSDCHSSDGGKLTGGLEAQGPHGSNVRPLLAAPYETRDGTSESASAYALCYSCHERTSILGNNSFSAHSLHVVQQQTPCSVCHDSHGIASGQGSATNHAHLINFDTTVVQRDPVTGLLEYRMTGTRTGTCYLTCHGVAHSPKSYPSAGPAVAPVTPIAPRTTEGLTPLRSLKKR
jgi:predicted CXXCH cytochrome family protein